MQLKEQHNMCVSVFVWMCEVRTLDFRICVGVFFVREIVSPKVLTKYVRIIL